MLLGLVSMSAMLGWLETRPPAWLDEDPLTHPLGLDFLETATRERRSAVEDVPEERRPPIPTDVNRARTKTLQRLPGVGPVTAGRIIAWRDSVGPFDGPASLLEVKGIGPKTLEKIRPFLRFEPDSTTVRTGSDS